MNKGLEIINPLQELKAEILEQQQKTIKENSSQLKASLIGKKEGLIPKKKYDRGITKALKSALTSEILDPDTQRTLTAKEIIMANFVAREMENPSVAGIKLMSQLTGEFVEKNEQVVRSQSYEDYIASLSPQLVISVSPEGEVVETGTKEDYMDYTSEDEEEEEE